jgi:hypothetical protein
VSFCKAHLPDNSFTDLYIGAVYVPNASSCAPTYTKTLYGAIRSKLIDIKETGSEALIGLDANIPYSHPDEVIVTRNSRLINDLIEEFDLVVLNWLPCVAGFATRGSHQLDIFLATRPVATSVTSLTIDPLINFGSDHCAVNLTMKISCLTKADMTPRESTIYDWSLQSSRTNFENSLIAPLDAWDTKVHAGPQDTDLHSFVKNTTESLTSTIISAATSSVPHVRSTHRHGTRRTFPWPNSIQPLIRARSQAQLNRDVGHREGADPASLLALNSTLQSTKEAVRNEFNLARRSVMTSQWKEATTKTPAPSGENSKNSPKHQETPCQVCC